MACSYEEAPPVPTHSSSQEGSHYAMFQIPDAPNGVPVPKKLGHTSSTVVEMPNSPNEVNPNCGRMTWKKVCETFEKKCPSTFVQLRRAILSYKDYDEASFVGLKNFLEIKLSEEERKFFFQDLLPKIINLALSLPQEVPSAIPLLSKHASTSLSLSQKQIGVLLANAFLCTFPDREMNRDKCGHGDYADINFNRLFQREEKNAEHKFRCIFNYFRRITTAEPTGVVTFSRQFVSPAQMPRFEDSSKPLPRLRIELEGGIETAEGHLQTDFADKYIGGMVMTKGCVQEEIRFLLCPELILARLFTPIIQEAEALIVTGMEQYNRGKGYARDFQFTGDFVDTGAVDAYRRRRCQMTAIDAICFSRRMKEQYKPAFIIRDMQKAYAGFSPLEGTSGPLAPVATGNWGCGIFRGNPKLKSLLQLIAAGEAGRDVTFYAFGMKKLVSELGTLYKDLMKSKVTVGELTQILLSFSDAGVSPEELYDYIRERVAAAKISS